MNNLLLKRAKRALVGWFFISFQQNNILCDYAISGNEWDIDFPVNLSHIQQNNIGMSDSNVLNGFYFKNIERMLASLADSAK